MLFMPFGRFRGLPLDEVPTGYLQWLLDHARQVGTRLRLAVANELLARDHVDRGSACHPNSSTLRREDRTDGRTFAPPEHFDPFDDDDEDVCIDHETRMAVLAHVTEILSKPPQAVRRFGLENVHHEGDLKR